MNWWRGECSKRYNRLIRRWVEVNIGRGQKPGGLILWLTRVHFGSSVSTLVSKSFAFPLFRAKAISPNRSMAQYLSLSHPIHLPSHIDRTAPPTRGTERKKLTMHALPIPSHLPIKKPILIPCPHLLLLRHLFLPPFQLFHCLPLLLECTIERSHYSVYQA